MMRRNLACVAVLLGLVWTAEGVGEESIRLTDDTSTYSVDDREFQFVMQPSAVPETSEAAPATAPRSGRSTGRSSYSRLSRAPNMFGDSLGNGGQLTDNAVVFFTPVGGNTPVECRCGTGDFIDLPGIGGGVSKIGDNNKPVPMDRVYFNYNGFQNALSVAQPVPRDINVNRYTIGIEKTFHDGLWSINVSMPLFNSMAIDSSGFSGNSGTPGNLGLFLKRLVFSDDVVAVSTGVGFSLPTGSDLTVQIHQFNPIRATDDTENLVIQNEALHLVPYIGFLEVPNDDWFLQGFLSLDLAASGNPVVLGAPGTTVGYYNPQNLLHIDLSIGRWLLQNPDAYRLTGLAAVAELHYTSMIQNSDSVLLPTQPDVGPFVNGELTNLANRTDVLNATAGVQLQISELSNLRVGMVFPLMEQPYRDFDAEAQVSFNRNF